MKIFSIPRRMANAAVVFVRRRGLISDHARETGQSRETLYTDARRVQQQVDQAERDQQRLIELEQKITTLEEQLKQATVIDDDRMAEFASTAQAEGVSLPVTRRLLGVFCVKRHLRWPRSDGAATDVRPVGGDSPTTQSTGGGKIGGLA